MYTYTGKFVQQVHKLNFLESILILTPIEYLNTIETYQYKNSTFKNQSFLISMSKHCLFLDHKAEEKLKVKLLDSIYWKKCHEKPNDVIKFYMHY